MYYFSGKSSRLKKILRKRRETILTIYIVSIVYIIVL
nr:MAG TPA: hypothetical protein [Bacteriophage sp.]